MTSPTETGYNASALAGEVTYVGWNLHIVKEPRFSITSPLDYGPPVKRYTCCVAIVVLLLVLLAIINCNTIGIKGSAKVDRKYLAV